MAVHRSRRRPFDTVVFSLLIFTDGILATLLRLPPSCRVIEAMDDPWGPPKPRPLHTAPYPPCMLGAAHAARRPGQLTEGLHAHRPLQRSSISSAPAQIAHQPRWRAAAKGCKALVSVTFPRTPWPAQQPCWRWQTGARQRASISCHSRRRRRRLTTPVPSILQSPLGSSMPHSARCIHALVPRWRFYC